MELENIAGPLEHPSNLDGFLDLVGDSRIVMLGEASHGTREYYEWRAAISKRLIEEKDFSFIAVEGDWPDCYEVNRAIKGGADAKSARDVLSVFARWPTWMWANWEVARLVGWMRDYNANVPETKRAGFYGLDVYSLWDSLRAVITYLQRVDPSAVKVAEGAYRCFEPYGDEAYDYAHAVGFVPESCEKDVAGVLAHLRAKAARYKMADGESYFSAEQNALVAKNAEDYYRTMLQGSAESWNVRDTHMAETLSRLLDFHGSKSKAIVWAHNTHVGDARATDMAREGMVNIGQLAREQHRKKGVVLAGFGSYQGEVIAARAWDAPMKHMPVPPAQRDSWEEFMHGAFQGEDRILDLTSPAARKEYAVARGHRAIGVVYAPEREYGNYVPTVLSKRYDAFLFLDTTTALRPFHLHPEADPDLPETFPSGV